MDSPYRHSAATQAVTLLGMAWVGRTRLLQVSLFATQEAIDLRLPWFLAWLSWKRGGLYRFPASLVDKVEIQPERVGVFIRHRVPDIPSHVTFHARKESDDVVLDRLVGLGYG